jgi:hypothetical protein
MAPGAHFKTSGPLLHSPPSFPSSWEWGFPYSRLFSHPSLFLSFPSLWLNNWDKQFKGEKHYLGLFHRFYSMAPGPCCFWAHGKAEHHGMLNAMEQICSLPGDWEAKRERKGTESQQSLPGHVSSDRSPTRPHFLKVLPSPNSARGSWPNLW